MSRAHRRRPMRFGSFVLFFFALFVIHPPCSSCSPESACFATSERGLVVRFNTTFLNVESMRRVAGRVRGLIGAGGWDSFEYTMEREVGTPRHPFSRGTFAGGAVLTFGHVSEGI